MPKSASDSESARHQLSAIAHYHRALMHHPVDARFELKQVSSVDLARTREALHNRWDKNDPKNAQVILHMLEFGAVQVIHDPVVAASLIAPLQPRIFSSDRNSSSQGELYS